MILAPDIQTHAPDTEEKSAFQRFTTEYDHNQQERKLRAEFIKPSTFQGLHATLWELGFYLQSTRWDNTTDSNHRKAREIMLEKMPLEQAETEEEREALKKFRRLVEVMKNAEYLSTELTSLQVEIIAARSSDDITPDAELSLGYQSPPQVRLTYDLNEKYCLAAKKAGYTDEELALIFDRDDEGKLFPPRGHRQKNRSRDSLECWTIPISPDDPALLADLPVDQNSAPQFFADHQTAFQEKVATVQNVEVVLHGFTGDEKMTSAREPQIETDLAEAYFANLTSAEQKHAAVLAWRKLGPFDETVNMENGYGPFDYAQEVAMDLSATGLTHASENTIGRSVSLIGHSMGGAAVEHLAINYRSQMLKNENIDWTFGFYHPARIGKGKNQQTGEDETFSTHHWSDASLDDEDEQLLQQLARRGTAAMLQGVQLALKKIVVESPGKLAGKKISEAIGAIYKYPEAFIATLLTNSQLLKKERCQKLVKSHLDRLQEDTAAATFTAVGSNHDIPVSTAQVTELVTEEKGRHKEFYVSADGPNIKDKMVNTKKTLQGLPSNVPLFVLHNGTHYAFKWRTNQFAVDTLQHTARRLDRSNWQFLMQLTYQLYEARKQRGYQDLTPEQVFDFVEAFHIQELAAHLYIDIGVLKSYFAWRGRQQKTLQDHQDELRSVTEDRQLMRLKAAKQQTDPNFQLDLRHIYSSHPDRFVHQFDHVQKANSLPALSEEEWQQLNVVEQMLRFLDVCGNLAHFNDPEDPVITRDFSSRLPESVQQRNRNLHIIVLLMLPSILQFSIFQV